MHQHATLLNRQIDNAITPDVQTVIINIYAYIIYASCIKKNNNNGRVESNVNRQYNSNWAVGNSEILTREQLTKNMTA